LVKKPIDTKKKTNAQTPLRENDPKMGSNNPNANTVKIELLNKIFNPKPIGNIWMKGTMMINVGIANKQFKNQLDF
jgi:hypothetical protein